MEIDVEERDLENSRATPHGLGVTAPPRKFVAVIPAYNEERTIQGIVRRASPHVDTVLVVDDASTDRTAQLAGEAGALVIRHRKNLGIGAALGTAYRGALEAGGDIIVQLDADGQHDPALIPRLLESLDSSTDVVVASRFLDGSHREYTIFRRLGIRFFSLITSILGGTRVSDVTSGLRVSRATVVSRLPLQRTRHWAVEQTLTALLLGFRVKEVPARIPPRRYGKSQFGPDVALLYPIRMVSSIFRALRHSRAARVGRTDFDES